VHLFRLNVAVPSQLLTESGFHARQGIVGHDRHLPAIIWTPQKNAHPGGGPALLGQASIGRSTAAAQARSA